MKEYVVITVIIGFITHVMLSNNVDYKKCKNESWYCISCTEEIFSFCHIEKKEHFKPPPSLVNLINQLNNFIEETKDFD